MKIPKDNLITERPLRCWRSLGDVCAGSACVAFEFETIREYVQAKEAPAKSETIFHVTQQTFTPDNDGLFQFSITRTGDEYGYCTALPTECNCG